LPPIAVRTEAAAVAAKARSYGGRRRPGTTANCVGGASAPIAVCTEAAAVAAKARSYGGGGIPAQPHIV